MSDGQRPRPGIDIPRTGEADKFGTRRPTVALPQRPPKPPTNQKSK